MCRKVLVSRPPLARKWFYDAIAIYDQGDSENNKNMKKTE